jgi:hypothetical protein
MWLIGMILVTSVITGIAGAIGEMRQPWSGLAAITFTALLIASVVVAAHH